MRNINLIDILNGQTDILELNKIAYEPLIDMKNKNLKLHFYLDKGLYENMIHSYKVPHCFMMNSET